MNAAVLWGIAAGVLIYAATRQSRTLEKIEIRTLPRRIDEPKEQSGSVYESGWWEYM